MTVLRALIIEDNPPDAVLVQAAVGRAGFETTHVLSGADAVEAVKADEYHLILVDLCLPDIEANDLIIALRGMGNGARSKIIAHTSVEDAEVHKSAMAHGADDVFLKNANRVHLFENRFKGLAHKLKREEHMYFRIAQLEVDVGEIKSSLKVIAENTAAVKDLSEAWVHAKGFVNVLIVVGKVLDKTKWVWGPMIAIAVGVKTGVVSIWTPTR